MLFTQYCPWFRNNSPFLGAALQPLHRRHDGPFPDILRIDGDGNIERPPDVEGMRQTLVVFRALGKGG